METRQVREITQQEVDRCCQIIGIDTDDVLVYVEPTLAHAPGAGGLNQKRALGQAGYDDENGYHWVRISSRAAKRHGEEVLLDTVRHEMAHVMARVKRCGRGHDGGWQRCCMYLGATPRATFRG
jgi:hypothetical protein